MMHTPPWTKIRPCELRCPGLQRQSLLPRKRPRAKHLQGFGAHIPRGRPAPRAQASSLWQGVRCCLSIRHTQHTRRRRSGRGAPAGPPLAPLPRTSGSVNCSTKRSLPCTESARVSFIASATSRTTSLNARLRWGSRMSTLGRVKPCRVGGHRHQPHCQLSARLCWRCRDSTFKVHRIPQGDSVHLAQARLHAERPYCDQHLSQGRAVTQGMAHPCLGGRGACQVISASTVQAIMKP